MDLKRLLHSDSGRIILSILLGLGLSTLFRKICTEKDCLAFYSAPKDDLLGKTFQHEDRCFQYQPKSVKCDPSEKKVIGCQPAKCG